MTRQPVKGVAEGGRRRGGPGGEGGGGGGVLSPGSRDGVVG